MGWFSPFVRDLVDLSSEEIQPDAPPPGSLLDRGRMSVGDMLAKLRSSEENLVDEIADRTERLRQTRVAIEAFEAADKIMTAGDPDFAEVDSVPNKKRSASRQLRGSAQDAPAIVMKHTSIAS